MNEQCTQIGVATLADAEQILFATAGTLPGYGYTESALNGRLLLRPYRGKAGPPQMTQDGASDRFGSAEI